MNSSYFAVPGRGGASAGRPPIAAGMASLTPAAVFSLMDPQPARPLPVRATVTRKMIWRTLAGIGSRLRPDPLWMMDLGCRREQARRFFVDRTISFVQSYKWAADVEAWAAESGHHM